MSSEVPAQWALPLEILLCILQNLDHVDLRTWLRVNRELHAAISRGESFRRTLFKSRVFRPALPPLGTLTLHPIFEKAKQTVTRYPGTPCTFSANFEHIPSSRITTADLVSDDLITQPPLCVLGMIDHKLSDGSYIEAHNKTGVTVGDFVQTLCKQIQNDNIEQPYVERVHYAWRIYRTSEVNVGVMIPIVRQEFLDSKIDICSGPCC